MFIADRMRAMFPIGGFTILLKCRSEDGDRA